MSSPLPSSFDTVCYIRHCDLPARWTIETVGHPNGDAAGAYCTEHARGRSYLWEESPAVYRTVVSGPFQAAL
jgi:hypothetical protein